MLVKNVNKKHMNIMVRSELGIISNSWSRRRLSYSSSASGCRKNRRKRNDSGMVSATSAGLLPDPSSTSMPSSPESRLVTLCMGKCRGFRIVAKRVW
jgi:hypothetical protein